MYYIYLILNKINGKTYIGKRKTYTSSWNNDKYMGSGKRIKALEEKVNGSTNI